VNWLASRARPESRRNHELRFRVPSRGLFLAEFLGFAAMFGLDLPLHLNTIEVFLHASITSRGEKISGER
jgi:hypothetical protein